MDATLGFRARLREALERRGMSQTELARQLGVRVATVNEWLNRETMPSGAIMLQLPRVLTVDGHWLLTGERRTPEFADGPGPDQLHRASELLSEALLVLNGRGAGRGGVRRSRAAGDGNGLDAPEPRLRGWDVREPARRRTGTLGASPGTRARDGG